MNTAYNKPLPEPQKWSRAFWDGAKQGKLLLKRCKDCGHIDHPPYMYCTECMSFNHEWIEASGKGKIHTFTTTYLGAPPAFAHEQPYTVAMIDLEEGVRMLSNIIGAKPEDIKIDLDVEAVFEDVTDEITLVKFKIV